MFRLLLSLILGKEADMALVYATLIIKGYKKYTDVPMLIRDRVKEALIELECEHLVIEE